MTGDFVHGAAGAWRIAGAQHDVIERKQLLQLGFSRHAIDHRLAIGRLHRLWDGVYALGSPHVTRKGRWMAAVLACGSHAVLSHSSAAELWGLDGRPAPMIHVSVPASVRRRRSGITVHRRRHLPEERITIADGIRATDPILTLVDVAALWPSQRLEAAVNQADKFDLVNPESLREALDDLAPIPGCSALRRLLDLRTFVLTDSELERMFLAIVRRAGLPRPQTGRRVNGFKVDFFWPSLGLIVETDGLRYHRTAGQQAVDRRRDQIHTAAGFTTLRFAHAQVAHQPGEVARILTRTVERLRARR